MSKAWRLGGQPSWNGDGWDELPTGRGIWHEEDGAQVPVIEMSDWFDDASLELIASAPALRSQLATLTAESDRLREDRDAIDVQLQDTQADYGSERAAREQAEARVRELEARSCSAVPELAARVDAAESHLSEAVRLLRDWLGDPLARDGAEEFAGTAVVEDTAAFLASFPPALNKAR